ncbi:superoxide dismutase family protein [Mycolicibacterium sp. 120322]
MMKPIAVAAVVAVSVIGAGACSNQSSTGGGESGTPQTTGAAGGALKTDLKTSDGTTVANASIEFANGYATITVQSAGTGLLSPGFHGLQIHSVGTCDFSSPGSPLQVSGHNTYSASGDLADLQVRPDGGAKLVTTSADFTAADLQSGQGTSLVLDAGPTNRSGAASSAPSGKPVACGVIAAGTATSTSTSTSTVTATVVAPGAPAATTTSPTSTTTPSPTTGTTTTSPSTSTVTVTVPPTTVTSPQVPNVPGQPAG